MRLNRWCAWGGLLGASIIACFVWLFQQKWGLGVRDQWVITPHEMWPLGSWGLPLVVLFLFGGMAALSVYDSFTRAKTPAESKQSMGLSVGALVIFALLWPWFLLGPGGTTNLVAATFSDVSNQYFSTAWQMNDAREFTRNYAHEQQSPPSVMLAHVATHPPGAVLFYYGARRLYEAVPPLKSTFEAYAKWQSNDDISTLALSANSSRRTASRVAGSPEDAPDLPTNAAGGAVWSAFILSLIAALCVPAVYWLAGMGAEELRLRRARGIVAAALFAVAPALGIFTFTIDTLIAAGVLWALVFLALGLRQEQGTQKYFYLFICGVLSALSCFISFGALAMGAIIAIVVFWKRRNILINAGVIFAGFAATILLLWALFPMDLLTIFRQAMQAHDFATLQSRSWGKWAWINIVIFAIFAGLPLWWTSICSAVESVRKKYFSVAIQIGIAAIITLLLVSISGNARGEIERLWLFLIAPLAILAAQIIDVVPSRKMIIGIATALVLACVQTLLMAAVLGPLVRPF